MLDEFPVCKERQIRRKFQPKFRDDVFEIGDFFHHSMYFHGKNLLISNDQVCELMLVILRLKCYKYQQTLRDLPNEWLQEYVFGGESVALWGPVSVEGSVIKEV